MPAVFGSKREKTHSDKKNAMRPAPKATENKTRTAPRGTSSSAAAPTAGRKTIRLKPVTSSPPPPTYENQNRSEQKREEIMLHVAALEPPAGSADPAHQAGEAVDGAAALLLVPRGAVRVLFSVAFG